jgi:hypothetical protein
MSGFLIILPQVVHTLTAYCLVSLAVTLTAKKIRFCKQNTVAGSRNFADRTNSIHIEQNFLYFFFVSHL